MGSAETVLRALEAVATRQPMGVSELARRLGISKPAAQRALRALADERWIRRSGHQPGRWVLSVKVLEVAGLVGGELGLREVARPVLVELAKTTGEATHLSVLDGVDVVTIDEVESAQVVRIHWPIGTRAPAYTAANGKALLADLSEPLLAAHLPGELEAFTEHTITDREALERELAEIRRRGYAAQRGEFRADVASVASCIRDRTGQPIASLSVFMPSSRFPAAGAERLGPLVIEAAAKIAAGLSGG